MNMNDKQMLYILQHMIENPYMGVLYIDTSCQIILVNQTFADILEVDRDSLIGKHVNEVIPRSRLPYTISNGETNLCELCCVNHKEMISMRVPIYNEGEIVGAMAKTLFLDMEAARIMVQHMNNLQNSNSVEKHAKYYGKYTLDDIVGNSQNIVRIKTLCAQVANNVSNVLIIGESGTGKELFAHAIHNSGYRRNNPFVRINCACIPQNLLESELFGYEEGSFTGAKKGGKIGKFELAHEGTIFLDEIGELPLMMQAKLLSFLQEREFERIGGSKLIQSDVRIIAATNTDLVEAIAQGSFREDLYYRLNVVSILIPPLKNRLDDIEILIKHFISKINQKLGTAIAEVDEESLALLKSYEWPGNIRELENIIERAINLASLDRQKIIQAQYLPTLQTGKFFNHFEELSLNQAVEDLEYQMISETLRRNNYNKAVTARSLNIHPSVLYRKLKKYEIS
jgi:transcriptional regulator with PAS, ATPase and Fis domain